MDINNYFIQNVGANEDYTETIDFENAPYECLEISENAPTENFDTAENAEERRIK